LQSEGVVRFLPSKPVHRQRGSALLEALIAMAIVIAALTGVAQLLLASRRAVWSAGTSSAAAVLASEKLEQLRSLTWSVDDEGRAVSDETTDLSSETWSSGGTGLRPSPVGTLRSNVAGFVDYLTREGAWCGNGTVAPAGAAFVRRWAILPLAADPLDTIVLHVTVAPLAEAAAGEFARSPAAATVTTIRTRDVW
jgi:type II secretory pathway pseudopilin PulG